MSQLLFFLAGLILAIVIAVATGSIRGGMDIPSLRLDGPRETAPPGSTDPANEALEWLEYDRAYGLADSTDQGAASSGDNRAAWQGEELIHESATPPEGEAAGFGGDAPESSVTKPAATERVAEPEVTRELNE